MKYTVYMWEILKEAILKIILKETMLKPWSLSFLIDLWGRFFTRTMTAENYPGTTLLVL